MINQIAVILSIYHINLWNNFKDLLLPFQDNINLYLCLYSDNGSQKDIISNANKLFNTKVSFHKNYGADISPFLQILESVNEPYFIKLHSKKSLLGDYKQINWRNILLYDFLGNQDIFKKNYRTIRKINCGAIGNKNLLLHNNESYHSNQIKELCKILDINYANIKDYSFFGGNMFMSKTALFKKHFLPYMDDLDKLLSKEIKKVIEKPTGTFSHALERIFGYIIPYNHLEFATVQHNTIKILNNKAPNGIFNMITLHNNDCYLQEDINVYGQILDTSSDNFSIRWNHLPSNPIQKYEYVGENTIIQKNG